MKQILVFVKCCISLLFTVAYSQSVFASEANQQVLLDAVNYERQSITVALTQEPPNLNSTQTTDTVSSFVLGHVSEGLVRYGRRGVLVPGVAESWQQNDGKITFTLRKDAKWSDGSSVTAADFVYGWRLVNDPANAAPYGSIMYPIKNAEKIQKGELSVDQLGVRAIDEQTLEVSLENSCGYCLSLMVHMTFLPVKQSFYEANLNRYGAEPANLLYNGPFVITHWTHGAKLVMEKNIHYWNRDDIKLNTLNIGYITEDNRTRLNLFRDDSIALVRFGAETVKDAANQGFRLKTFVTGGMSFMRFNTMPDRFTANKHIRQAVRLTFSSEEFVNKVIGIPGYKAAYSFFPSWLNGGKGKFNDEYPVDREKLGLDLDMAARESQAKALVAKGLQEMGLTEAPTITLLTVSSPTGAKIAEYFQGKIKQTLGIEVKIDQQTFKQFLDKNDKADFDMSLGSWYPDFDDIVTYADLLASYSGNNKGRFKNAEYDMWLKNLQQTSSSTERMAAAAELQRIIIEEVPLFPMAETGSAYAQHPKLKGVQRRVLGADPDYTQARVIK